MQKNIRKFIKEFNENGINTSLVKTGEYIYRKIEKIMTTIKLFSAKDSPVVSWADYAEDNKNFGDALNPILVGMLSKKSVINYAKLLNTMNKTVYSVIGSVLNNKNIDNLEVWGSGFISEEGKFLVPPRKIHAVRGPLTRDLILKQGLDCPEVYGDPALLMPLLYKPAIEKKFRIGIVPHYVDKDNKYLKMFRDKYIEDAQIIDIQEGVFQVIDNINKCELIASSSLHGIIIADAYNIPSLWIKLSDNIVGDEFKFIDYNCSVDKKQMKPVVIKEEMTMNDLIGLFSYEKINFKRDELLKSCPFIGDKTICELLDENAN